MIELTGDLLAVLRDYAIGRTPTLPAPRLARARSQLAAAGLIGRCRQCDSPACVVATSLGRRTLRRPVQLELFPASAS